MAASTIKASAPASDVREWLVKEGRIDASQKRGKFTQDDIKAYNACHGLKYRQGKFVKTVTVTAKPAKGRTVTRKVIVAEARAAAVKAGRMSASHGKVSQAILAEFVLTDGTFNV